jgi:hypothetical protein
VVDSAALSLMHTPGSSGWPGRRGSPVATGIWYGGLPVNPVVADARAGWAPACGPAADAGEARAGPATRARAVAVTADSHQNLLVIKASEVP